MKNCNFTCCMLVAKLRSLTLQEKKGKHELGVFETLVLWLIFSGERVEKIS